MARVVFTSNLLRHVDSSAASVAGGTIRTALEQVFAANQVLRGYIVDEHGRLRKHMAIFVDGRPLLDREALSDPIGESSEIYVIQALSGG